MSKHFFHIFSARKIFGTLLGESGGMLPQNIFKIESARLA